MARAEQIEACPACGGTFAKGEGSTHPYMLSTVGCWNAYGELLTREYENPALFEAVHRLTVDAYALQHPGNGIDRRAVQSVWVHYAALHMAIEGGRPPVIIPSVMQKLTERSFPPLPSGSREFALTHADVLAMPISDHVGEVRRWAFCTYEAWQILRVPTQHLLETL